MKRTIKFERYDNKYIFTEGENRIFEINNDDLQVDVKNFYSAFFAENMDYSDIELYNSMPDDKEEKRVFCCIQQLVKEVSTRLMEDAKKSECKVADKNSEYGTDYTEINDVSNF